MGSWMCSRRSNHPAAADWVPDNQSERCLSCDREFSAFYRRHHCRACGKLVCANCSSRSDFLPQFGYSLRQPVRICDACSSKDKSVIELEKEMFILCKKAKYRRVDAGLFLAEFANKLRIAKCTDGFSEHLLKYCTDSFSTLFFTLYEPINSKLTQILASPEKCSENEVDDTLDQAMFILRSWKNLENDIPNLSAKAFLKKVELVERWKLGPFEPEKSKTTLQRVVSSPNMSFAAQCFHRHRSYELFSPCSNESDANSSNGDSGRKSKSINSISILSNSLMPPPSPMINQPRRATQALNRHLFSQYV